MNRIVLDAVEKFGDERENLLTVMQDVVVNGTWLSEELIEDISAAFELSPAEVYGIASFYSFLNVEPRGKYTIRLCRTISCDMAGKMEILNAIKDILHIEVGETTPDHMFTLLETNCMGWCHRGPAMLINDTVYTELTPVKAVEILQKYFNNTKQSN